jgi:hypothetical protein
VQSGITLGSSNITDWSQIGGTGTGSGTLSNLTVSGGLLTGGGTSSTVNVSLSTNSIQGIVEAYGYRTTDSNAVIAVGSGCSIVPTTNGTVVTYTLTVPPSGTDSNTVNALWWANAATGTVANALAGWPTQWSGGSITSAVANATTATVWTASGGYVQTNHTGNINVNGELSAGDSDMGISTLLGLTDKDGEVVYNWSNRIFNLNHTFTTNLTVLGVIYGDGSGLTNIGYAASSGIASNVHSGNATTGQVATANGSGGTFWATPAAGGATTPWTNSIMLRTGSFRNATTNDFLGGIITGNETLDTASGASVALFNTVANAATNLYNGSAWFVFPWPAGNDMTTLQLGFRKSGTTATNFPLTLMYSNRLTQATASMVLTGQAPVADTTYWTNMSIASSICTQAVQGSEWLLRWDASFGASVSTTQGYMGIAIQGTLFK